MTEKCCGVSCYLKPHGRLHIKRFNECVLIKCVASIFLCSFIFFPCYIPLFIQSFIHSFKLSFPPLLHCCSHIIPTSKFPLFCLFSSFLFSFIHSLSFNHFFPPFIYSCSLIFPFFLTSFYLFFFLYSSLHSFIQPLLPFLHLYSFSFILFFLTSTHIIFPQLMLHLSIIPHRVLLSVILSHTVADGGQQNLYSFIQFCSPYFLLPHFYHSCLSLHSRSSKHYTSSSVNVCFSPTVADGGQQDCLYAYLRT